MNWTRKYLQWEQKNTIGWCSSILISFNNIMQPKAEKERWRKEGKMVQSHLGYTRWGLVVRAEDKKVGPILVHVISARLASCSPSNHWPHHDVTWWRGCILSDGDRCLDFWFFYYFSFVISIGRSHQHAWEKILGVTWRWRQDVTWLGADADGGLHGPKLEKRPRVDPKGRF